MRAFHSDRSSDMAQRIKRKDGGFPVFTKGMSQGLKDLSLPVLDYLTQRIQEEGGASKPRGDERFAYELRPGNYFEAMAVVLSRGSQNAVKPHMDRQNDHREGYNVMGALAFTGHDDKGLYRIGVLGYTRQCVGDHLAWEAKEAVKVSKARRSG